MNLDIYKIPHTFKLLPTQTKVRRLGYLKFIIQLFRETEYYPLSYLPKKVEDEAEAINGQLEDYKTLYSGDNKGIIQKTKTGISAKYYLDLAENLQLLTKSNNSYVLSKQGKLFLVLLEEFSSKKKNLFKLELFERIYFVLQILINDPVYSFTLLELIFDKNNVWITKEFRNTFYDKVLENLKSIQFSDLLTKRESKELDNILLRFSKWKKKEKYLEHIIEPRVNWLLDIGFLDNIPYQSEKLNLSSNGEKYFLGLKKLYVDYGLKILINNFIVQNHFFSLMKNVYDIHCIKFYDAENLNDELLFNLEMSFSLFKTLAPYRVNAYQAIFYTCFVVFLKNGTLVEFAKIKKYLETNKRFSLEWFITENDGSLKINRG